MGWILAAVVVVGCNKKRGSTASGGDSAQCKAAVERLDACEVPFDSSSDACSPLDECVSDCILSSSCEELQQSDGEFVACTDTCLTGGEEMPGETCKGCSDYLRGKAAPEDLCATSLELLTAWGSCICDEVCASACYDSACMGFEANLICADCVEFSCEVQTTACENDL